MFPKRVSLRVFLAASMAIAIGFGLFRIFILGPAIDRADTEHSFVEMGVTITRGNVEVYRPNSRKPGRSRPPISPFPSQWERMLSFLSQRPIDLRPATEISFLWADRFPSDRDLEQIRSFPEVERLDLTLMKSWKTRNGGNAATNLGSQVITDTGVANLATLPKLRELVIGDSQLSDAAFEALSHSSSLEVIGTSNSNISDRTLLHLAKIPSLRVVWMANNNGITIEGVREFRHLRPDVQLHCNFPSERVMQLHFPR